MLVLIHLTSFNTFITHVTHILRQASNCNIHAVITGSPPPPVQSHYSDQSVFTNVDSPAKQSFGKQSTSNQSSADLLTVEPTISHSTSASQPASLSDNSMTKCAH